MSGGSLTRSVLLSAAASVALALARLAPAAGASLPAKQAGKLSPLLQRLSGPALRSPLRRDRRRRWASPPAAPAACCGSAAGVLVEVRFDHGAVASRDEVRAAGGRVLDASRRYQTAAVAVPPDDLQRVAAVPAVASLRAGAHAAASAPTVAKAAR